MKSILTKIMAAALTMSLGIGMGVAPSFADDSARGMGFSGMSGHTPFSGYNYRYNGHRYRGQHNWRHNNWRHHRHHYRHGGYYYRDYDNDGAGLVGGLIAGAIIGGIAANALGNNGGGSAHVRWCYDHYRSYRASDNTYQPYHGPRRQCNSPY